ncbi:hypothetical protein SLS60_000248 [Paraconiothyrium brasiliense]|uniref:Anaphase-promoting complex subunit 11 n=1 Tax=Paraconiothyrium brasiliense TaxID=300254 RepID=A0ABR3S5P1_9PLEO
MADYPSREDFAWSGMEQLSKVPAGGENECPICKMSLLSEDTPPTPNQNALNPEAVPVSSSSATQQGESSETTILMARTSGTSVSTVPGAQAPLPVQPSLFGPGPAATGPLSAEPSLFSPTSNAPLSVQMSLFHREATTEPSDEATEDPDTGRFIRIRACGHIFHTACLRTWLIQPQNKTCSMCRRVLFNAPYGREATARIFNLRNEVTATRQNMVDNFMRLCRIMSDASREHDGVLEDLRATIRGRERTIDQLQQENNMLNDVLLHERTSAFEAAMKTAMKKATKKATKKAKKTARAESERITDNADYAFGFIIRCVLCIITVFTLWVWSHW